MPPAGVHLAALETYYAPKEVKEHVFEGSLINENKGGILDAPTFYVGFDVLCV